MRWGCLHRWPQSPEVCQGGSRPLDGSDQQELLCTGTCLVAWLSPHSRTCYNAVNGSVATQPKVTMHVALFLLVKDESNLQAVTRVGVISVQLHWQPLATLVCRVMAVVGRFAWQWGLPRYADIVLLLTPPGGSCSWNHENHV
jgi:hypothetical protein